MAEVNLADPTFEPTDEQLGELFKRAFADVDRTHRESLARLRVEAKRRGRAAMKPVLLVMAAARPLARCPAVGAAITSRFGEITPTFAAAFGANVDVGLLLGARNAQARALAASARSARISADRPTLPVEIATARALPPSRVCTAIITEPGC
jgi:hypothetical protein